MAPEYTMRGIVSMKNDIFAFGAILLETVSRSMCRSKPRGDCGLLHVYKWVSVCYAVAYMHLYIYTAKATVYMCISFFFEVNTYFLIITWFQALLVVLYI